MACQALPHFFTLSHTSENVTEYKKVFRFPLQRMSETFLILEEFREIQLKMFIGIHVKYQRFLSDFNKLYFFDRFSKHIPI